MTLRPHTLPSIEEEDAMDPADVLITSDAAKLPPDVVALLDPAVPLPPGVRFFETRFDLAHMTKGLLFAAGFALAAIVILPFGVAMLFERDTATNRGELHFGILGFGLLCAFVCWMMLASVNTARQFHFRQRRGECTRRGTFLTPAALVQATENDTTIIPPTHFRGLTGRTIAYDLKGVPKTFALPAAFIDATPQAVHEAIATWAAQRANLAI